MRENDREMRDVIANRAEQNVLFRRKLECAGALLSMATTIFGTVYGIKKSSEYKPADFTIKGVDSNILQNVFQGVAVLALLNTIYQGAKVISESIGRESMIEKRVVVGNLPRVQAIAEVNQQIWQRVKNTVKSGSVAGVSATIAYMFDHTRDSSNGFNKKIIDSLDYHYHDIHGNGLEIGTTVVTYVSLIAGLLFFASLCSTDVRKCVEVEREKLWTEYLVDRNLERRGGADIEITGV